MTAKELLVRLHGKAVGTLQQTAAGKMQFTYHTTATEAISISMPIREEPFNEELTEAYFGGLLPESETVKKIIAGQFGISHNNPFSLLKAIGYDCAGAISCHAIDEAGTEDLAPHRLTGRIITDHELYQHIKELPRKPLFLEVDGLRLSLAGVQDKAAICLIDQQIALAENGCPTTHILKPSAPHFPGIAENEFFCLRIAKRIGLPVPNIELRQIRDITFLLIERYDRLVTHQYVERIHQEDFCQALSISSTKKYQNEGGPGFSECFGLLNKTSLPAIDRNILARALVFNYLMGNMDAHGKNFSLLHHNAAQTRLAPFYDIVCTRAYPDLTDKMAMKIGGKYDTSYLLPSHWEQMCKEIHYRYIGIKDIISQQAENILTAAAQEKTLLQTSGHDHPIIDNIMTFLEKNITQTIKRFSKH